MNRIRISIKTLLASSLALTFTCGLLLGTQSCSESINEGNFAIAKEQTILDFLSADTAQYSKIKYIFDNVRLGSKKEASVLSSVLSARGNYTVFIPTNAAVNKYVTSLLGAGKDVQDLNEEQKKLIAYSCIIDNGNESAFESPDFPTAGGAFSKSDLSDRSITCEEKTDNSSTGGTYFLINGKNKVLKTDVKLSNGLLHVMESVIAPSNQQVPDLIKETENMRIMGALLDATGWSNKLSGMHYDLQYENEEREQVWNLAQVSPFNIAQHRYLCYTGFVETDDVFQAAGIPAPVYDAATKTVTNTAAIVSALTAMCEAAYGTKAQGDLKNEDNAINRFVAYHFLKGKLAHNQFVQHFNEWGYKYGDMKNPQHTTYSIDVWDYFVTVGSDKTRSLIKVTQDAADRGLYLNRVCTYNVADNYKQTGVVQCGVKVLPTNVLNGKTYDNNAKNGYFYPIDKILILDETARNALGNERIRFDLSTMLPELLSYGCRTERKYTYFPKLNSPRADGTTGYFENILNESEDTRLLYLHAAHYGGTGWRDYQGDEFMVAGVYDFVLRLPPVPRADVYEIRMGMSNNSLRGMCQIYFGENPRNLLPEGLPLDMRQPQSDNDNIGWFADGKDASINSENDKNMRNHGYMKCPRIFTACDGKGDTDCRNYLIGPYACIRRIVTTKYMEPGKTYYMRFKSALDKSDSQFFSDYFELVPKSVFNGTEPEDQW